MKGIDVTLRDVIESDLTTFFEQQLATAVNRLAAYTREDPTDLDAFIARWTRTLSDPAITTQAVLEGEQVAGYIASFPRSGKREVSYWLGISYWGRGIATAALRRFLERIQVRPLYARVAKDNVASMRVLHKCGFAICREDESYTNARGEDVKEFLLELRQGVLHT